jgi:HEPN domain-containing protein
MTARRFKTTGVERSGYSTYLKKAKEFYETMLQAQKERRWNAVGLNAVHCAISAADALLVFHIGQRSVDPDHRAVVELMSNSLTIPDAANKSETLQKIINQKNLIEYEQRAFTEKEAALIIKHTERFYTWVTSKLG